VALVTLKAADSVTDYKPRGINADPLREPDDGAWADLRPGTGGQLFGPPL